MSKRVSHSILDPWITVPFKRYYPWLPIPKPFPPEGIVLFGHLCALVGGVGFAYSTRTWWGGLVAAAGVFANHFADVFDGTHARATNQCRNGGELLDHFTDPLSFSYWISGLAIAIERTDLGMAGLIVLFATAVLTNIRAKIMGEFALASFGPTEFKTLLCLFGVSISAMHWSGFSTEAILRSSFRCFAGLLGVGVVQLVVNLVRSVREVNAHGAAADTSEWVTTRDSKH